MEDELLRSSESKSSLPRGRSLILSLSCGINESIVPASGGHAGQELAGDIGGQRWQAW